MILESCINTLRNELDTIACPNLANKYKSNNSDSYLPFVYPFSTYLLNP